MDPPRAAFDAVIGNPNAEMPKDRGVSEAAETLKFFGMPSLLLEKAMMVSWYHESGVKSKGCCEPVRGRMQVGARAGLAWRDQGGVRVLDAGTEKQMDKGTGNGIQSCDIWIPICSS